MKADLKANIFGYAKAVGYSEERIAEFLKGQTIFVDGVRGAVREAGWDVDEFDFYQSYLSAFVHSHPVSFMRADEHKISFSTPSPFQLGICGTIADLAAAYTEDVEKRMATFGKSNGRDPLGQVD